MKAPALQPRKGNASLKYEGMKFYGWPTVELAWWGLAFLIFAIVAGNRALNANVATWGGLLLLLSLLYVVFARRCRLLLMEGFLVERTGTTERRWKWSELDSIKLDRSRRSNRPVISFQTKTEGRV